MEDPRGALFLFHYLVGGMRPRVRQRAKSLALRAREQLLSTSERTIAVTTVLAITAWVTGLVGAIINAFVEPDVGTIAAAFLAAAICLTIRSCIAQSMVRASDAFKLGREEGRSSSGPRGL